MPLYDRMESPGQNSDIQRTGDPQDARHVVSASSGFELLEKPQSLLRERSWESLATPVRTEGTMAATEDGRAHFQSLRPRLLQLERQCSNCRRLEHTPHR